MFGLLTNNDGPSYAGEDREILRETQWPPWLRKSDGEMGGWGAWETEERW